MIWSHDGNLFYFHRGHEIAGPRPDSRFVNVSGGERSYGLRWPHYQKNVNMLFLRVPYWCLLVPAGVPTALLFFLDRRKIPPGHCQACGYDLRTLTSGRCPECGLAVEQVSR